jgi:hypothetical protein
MYELQLLQIRKLQFLPHTAWHTTKMQQCALAEDHNLPPGVLRILVKDENPYVSCRAKRTIDALSNAAATKSEPKGLVHWHSFSNRNFA